jgi:hypothetical protein
VRVLVGVLITVFVLALLGGGAVRGLHRVAGTDRAADAGRTTLQALVEGLVLLAVVILGGLVLVALLN